MKTNSIIHKRSLVDKYSSQMIVVRVLAIAVPWSFGRTKASRITTKQGPVYCFPKVNQAMKHIPNTCYNVLASSDGPSASYPYDNSTPIIIAHQ